MQARDDDTVSGRKAASHNPLVSKISTHGKLLVFNDIICINDHGCWTSPAIPRHAFLRREDCVFDDALRHGHLHIHPGQEKPVGVGELEA